MDRRRCLLLMVPRPKAMIETTQEFLICCPDPCKLTIRERMIDSVLCCKDCFCHHVGGPR